MSEFIIDGELSPEYLNEQEEAREALEKIAQHDAETGDYSFDWDNERLEFKEPELPKIPKLDESAILSFDELGDGDSDIFADE